MNSTDNQQGKLPGDYIDHGSKRSRAVSVSGRLRSASILCDSGKISDEDRDSMKDLILTQDPLIEQAFIEYEAGDETKLLNLVKSGYLRKKSEFSFLDNLGDFGLGNLSLNSYSEDIHENSSPFDFGNGYDIPIDHDMHEEYDLDGMDPVRLDGKRSRGSIDYPVYHTNQQIEETQDNHSNIDHFSGYSFNQNDEDTNTPNDFVNYHHTSYLHPDSMDYTSHYDGDNLGYSAQDNQYYPSTYLVDTSTLTLSEVPHSDEKRLPPSGLPPINTQIESQKKFIGIYSPESRKKRVERFFEKRKQRVWTKKVKYDVRKNFADSRLRVKGRFVKKEDEELLRELMNLA